MYRSRKFAHKKVSGINMPGTFFLFTVYTTRIGYTGNRTQGHTCCCLGSLLRHKLLRTIDPHPDKAGPNIHLFYNHRQLNKQHKSNLRRNHTLLARPAHIDCHFAGGIVANTRRRDRRYQ